MARVVYSNLFFFFFVAQIFSPYIAGVTIYLELIFALLDPYYRKWVISQRFDRRIYFALFLIPLFFLRPTISIKLLSLAISVSYLFYAYNNGCFYLKRYLCLSIYFAIAQFILFYFVPEASEVLGPTSIATYIWGDYATPTFTNFYEVLGDFIRVSGLSREAGFFASLILGVIVFCYMEWRMENKTISKTFICLLIVAFFVSLSKMSLLIVPIFLIIWLRKTINAYPAIVVILVFFVFLISLWYHSDYLADPEHETFTHRFGAYGIMMDINNPIDLLFGNKELDASNFTGDYANSYIRVIEAFDVFAGMGGYVLTNGIIMTLLLLILLINLNISTTGVLLLLVMTMNVQMDTNQNFVSLAYFIALNFFRKKSYAIC